jgi:tetratricopeptide (TPR) repeat protein
MPDTPYPSRPTPRSQLGLYRSWLTSPEHRLHITVGRSTMLGDTLETLRKNLGKKPKHHQLFIAPRGSGKTHLLSLIEDAIRRDPALSEGYLVARFPEEANRVLSFASFLLTVCEILDQGTPPDAPWHALYARLSTEDDDSVVADTLVKAFRDHYRKTGRILMLMVENLNQLMEEHIKALQSIQALRGFLMGDNGCLLIATSPIHFGALTKPDQPFYDFFDVQVLEPLTADDTIELIRRNLEWDKREDLLARFSELLPKLRAIHTLTGGSPRLTVMLYELLATESITAVKEQFMALQDRITPFYQDRLRDLSPQERAVLETIATMRDQPGKPAAPKTPGNIAKLMRMNQPQVSTLLSRLTKSLYLTTTDNPNDGRSTLYTIREGFFDLWLYMNLSRAARQRIPLLADFFASFYEQDAYRRLKREEYWQRLKAGEFNEDAAENLSYLSEVGTVAEKAAEKMKLIAHLGKAGDSERPALLKRELDGLTLDSTGCWIRDHLDTKDENYLDAIQEIIRCWETRRDGGLEAFAQRISEMGRQLSEHGWSTTRMEFLRDHIAALPLSAERVHTRLRLKQFLVKYGRWKEAGSQIADALAEAEQLNDERLIITTLGDQGYWLLLNDRFFEAEPILKRALTSSEELFGQDHPLVAIYLNNYAQMLGATGRLEEAEMLMRRALRINEASYGKEHFRVAVSLNNLAQLLKETNRFEEAEQMMHKALAIDEASLGSDHPKVAIRVNNLAQLMQAERRYAEAEPLLRRALAIDESVFGPNHPNVASGLNNLAQLMASTGREGKAEGLIQRALDILLQFAHGSGMNSHPHLMGVLHNHSVILKALGRTDGQIEAEVTALFAKHGIPINSAPVG